MNPNPRGLNALQKISMSLMGVLVLLTFIGSNLHALLWQSSDWLVSTVLPAVVVQLTNEERSDLAAIPLERNSVLDEAAKMKAEHMAKNEYFAHFSPDGVSPWYWFDEAGYVYAFAGENLAIHFTDSSEVVEAWMNSPKHRENIVNGAYTQIGVGTAKGTYDGYDTVYVVQLFGTPAIPPVPVIETSNDSPLVLNEVVAPDESPLALDQAVEPLALSAPPEEIVLESAPAADLVSDIYINEESLIKESADVQPELLIEPTFDATKVLQVDSSTIVTEFSAEIDSTEVAEVLTLTRQPKTVVVQSPAIATSSGLLVAEITTQNTYHAGATVVSVATQPNQLLQFIYLIIAVAVISMLGTSVVMEVRRLHFQQVAYGLFLLFGMFGLWFAHSFLTTGAVIV